MPVTEEKFIRVDGTSVDVEAIAIPIEYGSKPALQLIVRDISERKKKEQILKESEEKYRLIAENATDVIWVIDIQTRRFEYFSPSVYNLFGYTEDEALNHDFENDPNNPPDYIKLSNLIDMMIADFYNGKISQKRICVEVHQPTKSGNLIWVEVEINIITDEKNVPIKLLGIDRNIDRRKKAEIQLQKYADRLTQMNADKDRYM
ncbi:MAG TPA: PAS domain S-box protein [Bacteroidales bacterium]|nr:PAS domain S-box protein [Bacteroidales bacterium]HPS17367.1 PAS domain S-box protein [Bacteroidales bacterium]